MSTPPWDILKLLGDSTRLRLINLLLQEDLSVAELQDILDMGQSRISSHLSLLRQGNLVNDRKEGKKTFYSANPKLDAGVKELVNASAQAAKGSREIQEDLENLERILQKRRQVAEQYFNSVAGKLGKDYCPGRTWQAIGHCLLHFVPSIVVADLGAGEGMISQLLARQAKRVYCIDSSPKMVEVGTELAKRHEVSNLVYKLGDIEAIPLEDASVDVALMSQALHHAEHPQKAIEEAYRILKPGGKILVLDLKEHSFEKAHELYADRWLGFTENRLYQFLNHAGFSTIEVAIASREEEEPYFETILGSGIKEEAEKR